MIYWSFVLLHRNLKKETGLDGKYTAQARVLYRKILMAEQTRIDHQSLTTNDQLSLKGCHATYDFRNFIGDGFLTGFVKADAKIFE